MQVIFCDNHLLIVSKPAGLCTQPHLDGRHNLTDMAKAWVKKKYNKPGNVFLEPIHRLDQPVSGLVLFARSSKSLSRLQELMRQRQISKTYLAWVEGTSLEMKGTLQHILFHDEHRAKIVGPSHPHGKLALLHYHVIEQGANRSLVEIDLETGRYHQIRAQFSAMGYPVIGDLKYGSTVSFKDDRILLHHARLKFCHPVTKEALSFELDFSH